MKIHDDPVLRKSLGESGFEKVREYYSVDAWPIARWKFTKVSLKSGKRE